METNPSENQKNVAAVIHLSTFLKYFFPFGNFIAPLVIWTSNKDKAFVNEHGREAINFQLSILIYSLTIGLLCLPFFAFFAPDFIALIEVIDDHSHSVSFDSWQSLSGYVSLFFTVAIILFGVLVFELYAVINATVHANRGQLYRYPLSIPFIKTTLVKNQSENEHVS